MHKYRLIDITQISPGVVKLRLRPKRPGQKMEFQAGQYAAIGVKHFGRPSVVRCFSIVSSPGSEELEFGMRVMGRFTQAMAGLKPGAEVTVRGPYGQFVMDKPKGQVIMLAAGIGVTPMASLIRGAVEARRPVSMTLLYSCRSQNDIPFYHELIELERATPNFRVYFFISSGSISNLSEAHTIRGRISKKHLDQLAGQNYDKFQYFVCGPDGFMAGMKKIIFTEHPWAVVKSEEFSPTLPGEVIGIKSKPARMTYAFSAASLIAGTVGVMFLDLYQVAPKLIAQASTSVQSQSQATPSSAPASTPQATTTPYTSAQTVTPTTTTQTETPTPSQSTTTYPTSTSTSQPNNSSSYQQPVTQVS